MKFVALLFCCLMSCDCAHQVDIRHTNIDGRTMLDRVKPLTWHLLADYGGGRTSCCLATPVKIKGLGHMLLTARHCIDPLPVKIHARSLKEGRKYIEFKLYTSTLVFDLALLSPMSEMPKEAASLAMNAPERLDPYYQLRFKTIHQEDLVFDNGFVSQLRILQRGPIGQMLLSRVVPSGTSGGPIFDLRGALIGIQTHHRHCTPWLDIFRWITAIRT